MATFRTTTRCHHCFSWWEGSGPTQRLETQVSPTPRDCNPHSHGGGAVSVAVYDDRLEIGSAGTLPFGLRREDLKRDHQSRPRNPLIAEVFYRRGLVERWGRGTQRLVTCA